MTGKTYDDGLGVCRMGVCSTAHVRVCDVCYDVFHPNGKFESSGGSAQLLRESNGVGNCHALQGTFKKRLGKALDIG